MLQRTGRSPASSDAESRYLEFHEKLETYRAEYRAARLLLESMSQRQAKAAARAESLLSELERLASGDQVLEMLLAARRPDL